MLRQARTRLLNPISSMVNSIINSSHSMDNTSRTSHIKLIRRMLNTASMRNMRNSNINTRNIRHNHSTINSITLHLCRRRSI
jgi:hypothetical protein